MGGGLYSSSFSGARQNIYQFYKDRHRGRDQEKRVGRGRARTNIVHVCSNYVLVNSLSLPPMNLVCRLIHNLHSADTTGGPWAPMLFFQFGYTLLDPIVTLADELSIG